MDKKDYAIMLHDRGCNCAQSVACSFADRLSADEAMLMKITEGFGLGCGGMNGMCGALSGAITLIGIKYADGNIEAPKSKKATYAIAKKACDDFEGKCGSIICRKIKGVDSGKVLMPCPECIKLGVEIAEKVLNGEYENN